MMRELKVNLGERTYSIMIDTGLLNSVGELLKGLNLRSSKCLLITNPTVESLYAGAVEASMRNNGFEVRKVMLEDSENAKSLPNAEYIYDTALDFGIDRQSFIAALGGGVVGDLAGFAAATYMRGIPFIQIPTTLLAQVDSSVGGKVAVNYRDIKNLIGSFYQPKLVAADIDTLHTLPEREFKVGLAEVIKYGIIWDRDFFAFLEEKSGEILSRDIEVLKEIVYRSCEIKAKVVSRDEREEGLRAVLNLGHTFGHAVEALGGFKEFKHGEAVSIGACFAAETAVKIGMLSVSEKDRIISLFSKYGLPVYLPKEFAPADLITTMKTDKKNIGGDISLILPRQIGAVEKVYIKPEDLDPLIG